MPDRLLCQDQKTLVVVLYHYELWTPDDDSACDAAIIVLDLSSAIPSSAGTELQIPQNAGGQCVAAGGICNLKSVKGVVDTDTGACTEMYAEPDSSASGPLRCTPIAGYASLEFDPCLISAAQAEAEVRTEIEGLMIGGDLDGLGGGCVVKAVYVDRTPGGADLTTSSSKSVVVAENPNESGLSPGAVAGIVMGVLALLVAVALLVRRGRRRRNEGDDGISAKGREVGQVRVASGDGEEGVEIGGGGGPGPAEMDEIDRIVASVDAGKKYDAESASRQSSTHGVGGGDTKDETFVSEDGSSEGAGASSRGQDGSVNGNKSDGELSVASAGSSRRSAPGAETEVINGLKLSVSKDALDDENFELSIA